MIAFAVGTGVGINTVMAHHLGLGDEEKSEKTAGTGTLTAFVIWLIFAVGVVFFRGFMKKEKNTSRITT